MPEVLTTMGLLSILSSLGLMSFRDMQSSFRKNDARYTLDADLRRARTEAIAEGGRSILTVTSGGKSYRVGLDQFPFSSVGTPDKVLFQRKLPDGIKLSTAQTVVFDPRGYLVDVTGNYTTTAVSLSQDGGAYFSATIFTTGAMS